MYKESKGINIVLTLALAITLILTGYLLVVQVFGNGDDTEETAQRLIDVQPNQADETLQASQADDAAKASQADEVAPVSVTSVEKDAVITESGQNTVLTGSGRYEGQADSNFIEITVTDDKGNASPRVFQLNEALKERFDSLGLETGDAINFTYEEREGQNPLLHTLEKQ
jgi:hypothetical protein